ncbi:MAG: hypothetical protein ACRD2H_02535 [Terriglobales bacterium]
MRFPALRVFAVFLLLGVAATALGQSAPDLWIAEPADSSHVWAYTMQVRSAPEPAGQRTIVAGGFGMLISPAQAAAAMGSAIDPVPIGRPLALLLGQGAIAKVTVTAKIGVNGGSTSYLGIVAQVAPEDLEKFRAAKTKYFLLRPDYELPQPNAVGVVGPASRPAMARIEPLLRRRLSPELARVLADPEVARMEGRLRDVWERRDRSLQAGAGVLSFQAQEIAMPEGARFYARAKWTVGGVPAFLMSAWVALDPQPRILFSDCHAARGMRIQEYGATPPDEGAIPQVLIVIGLEGGRVGVIRQVYGYESRWFMLSYYTDSGLIPTPVGFGDGA